MVVGALLLLSCVAIVLGCRRIAQSGDLPLERLFYPARCVGYPRPSSRLSGVRNPGARDVWSMFARHRCHRLLSSGVETLVRAMCGQCSHVLAVIACCSRGRTLPRAMCVLMFARHRVVARDCRGSDPFAMILPLPPCMAMASRHRCHPSRLSGIGPFCSTVAGCVVNARTSSLTVIGCDCRESDPFIASIVSMCGECPHVITGCHRL